MKNIIFDIGMVLIDFHWDTAMRELGFSKEAVDHLGKNMIHHPLWHHLDLDDMPEDEIVKGFQEISPMYAKEIRLFFANMEQVVTMYEGADLWLKELKEADYNVYLLSNYPRRMFEMHMKKFYFLPYTDGRVVSYECHLGKPDPEIYRHLCQKYNILPLESVFLDDREDNILAAKELGFSTIHVKDPFLARRELGEFLQQHDR